MDFITLILGCVLVNNAALTSFSGLDTLALTKGKKVDIKTLGIATTIVMTVSTAVNFLINTYVLGKLNLGYLTILSDVVVILVVALAVEKFTSFKLGKYFLLVVLNGAVLSLGISNYDSVLYALVIGLASGAGYTLAMYIYRSIRRRVNDKLVPASFRGLPVDLLVIAIMAMAVTAFK